MSRGIEAEKPKNEKLFITTVDGRTLPVLFLNGSADFFPKPWDLSHLFNILDLPDHPESSGYPLEID